MAANAWKTTYFRFCPWILRNVIYGKGIRNRNLLDVYLPERFYNPHSENSHQNHERHIQNEKLAPVVIFVSGGAWIIGYKLWSALTARGLSKKGILTVVPDYRNFPQGDIVDMMEDIKLAVEWTFLNVKKLGGDPQNITLAGQSAGAHICLCLMVNEFIAAKELEVEQSGVNKATVSALDPTPTAKLIFAAPPLGVTQPPTKDERNGSGERPHSDSDDTYSLLSPRSPPVDWPPEDEAASDESSPDHELVWRDKHSQPPSPPSTPPAHPYGPSARSSLMEQDHDVLMSGTPSEATAESIQLLHRSRQFSLLPCVRMFVGVSGPFNLTELESHFQRRGFDSSILRLICGGDVSRYSPTEMLRSYCDSLHRDWLEAHPPVAHQLSAPASMSLSHPSHSHSGRSSRTCSPSKAGGGEPPRRPPPLADFPPVALIHGSADRTIPLHICTQLQKVLEEGGCRVAAPIIYEGWSHTDAILESPLTGDCRLFEDISNLITPGTDRRRVRRKDHAMISEFLANIARIINPF